MRRSESKDVKNRISVARRLSEEVSQKERRRALDYYSGDHWGQGDAAPVDWVTVNYLYPIVETKVAAIAFRNPDFTLRPMTEEAKESEETVRALLSYTFRKAKFLREARRIFRDYQIGGLGIGLTGWKQEWGAVGKPRLVTEVGRAVPLGEPLDPTPNVGEFPLPNAPLRNETPFVKRICPKDFFISPETGGDEEEAAYMGYTERVPLAYVKNHPRYKNTGRITGTTENLKDLFDDELRLQESRGETPQDLLRVTLHHYFDRPKLQYWVMCEETPDPLLVADWPYPYQDRYPFRIMRAADDEDRFYPKPTLLRYEHPQREINQSRSILARHQRQSVRKLQYNGRLSKANERQLSSDGALGIVQLEGQELIREVPHASVQPEIFRSEEAAKSDLQLLAAMNAYEAFNEPGKRVTTAEVQAIAAAGGARAKAEQESFEAWVSAVGADTLAYLQQYSVATRQIPVFEGGKVTAFRDFTLEEIQGEYWVDIFVGSTMVPNRQQLSEQLGLIMQSTPNWVQGVMAADQAGMNFRLLLRSILDGIPEIKDANQIVPDAPPQQDPMQMLSQMPPDQLAGLLGQAGALPGAQGGPPQGKVPPFPGVFLPDGSLDRLPEADAWLRERSDEDLGELAAFLGR